MMQNLLVQSAFLLLLIGLSGCGGTKVLKEPEPLVVTQSLATASDQHLSATLDWVIFRDGPGTWAKNVDWDEYMIGVHNLSGDSLQLTNITVVDSLGTPIEPRQSRKQLVKGTKETKRRYKGEGLKVKAGVSGGVLVGTAVVAAAGTSGLGAAAMAGGGAAAGAAAVVVLLPVLAVGGVLRGINNSKVNNQIESRQTLLPIVLEEEEKKNLVLFFPLSPSPRRIEISYVDRRGDHTLIVDTQAALDGLHLVQAKE
ncbi:MAG: hypothetical protein IH838_07570 [Proteobacteria bacterium]|nr:hypothetical protein [Pseudomonadota bacterium]